MALGTEAEAEVADFGASEGVMGLEGRLHAPEQATPTEASKLSAKSDGGLKVFRATRPEELDLIRDIAHEFHAESRFTHIPFSEVKSPALFSKAIREPQNTLAVYVQLPHFGNSGTVFTPSSLPHAADSLNCPPIAAAPAKTYRTARLIYAKAGEYFLGDGARMVTVHAMFASTCIQHSLLGGRIGVRLPRVTGGWAKAPGAEERHVHARAGIEPERTDKLLRRLGFKAYRGNGVERVGARLNECDTLGRPS